MFKKNLEVAKRQLRPGRSRWHPGVRTRPRKEPPEPPPSPSSFRCRRPPISPKKSDRIETKISASSASCIAKAVTASISPLVRAWPLWPWTTEMLFLFGFSSCFSRFSRFLWYCACPSPKTVLDDIYMMFLFSSFSSPGIVASYHIQ